MKKTNNNRSRIILVALIIVTFSYSVCNGQHGNILPTCNLLDALLKVEKVKNELHLDVINEKMITVIDSNNYFVNCKIPDLYGKVVQIVNLLPKELENKALNIAIIDIKSEKNKYFITFWYKSGGVLGTVEFISRRKGMKVKDVKLGNI